MGSKHSPDNDTMSSIPLLALNDGQSDGKNHASSISDNDFSDSDIEFNQDPLEGVLRSVLNRPRAVISREQCVISAFFCTSVALALGFLAAYLTFFIIYPTQCHKDASHVAMNSQKLISLVHPQSIGGFFRNITNSARPAGSTESQQIAAYIASQWKEYGLEEIEITSYERTLWLPAESPNIITYQNSQGLTTNISVRHRPLFSKEESDDKIYHPFAAHSAAAASEGKLIYANYGRSQDFAWLLTHNVIVRDSIIIARTGNISAGVIVSNAERHGAKGVILYCDPAECAAEGRANVYPDRLWLPSTGVKSESCRIMPEDITLEDTFNVKIPVQPISYENAEQLLETLNDVEPPSDWKGKLERISYHVMSKNMDRTVKIDVKTRAVNVTIQNVIGIIKGSLEQDRYILIGSRRDSWTFGGFGSASGSAALLETARVFGEMLKRDFRPMRTLMFCSWGAGEYNSLGSTQWAKDNYLNLKEKAVAYINLDALVLGHHTLTAHGSYLLHNLIRDASKKILNATLQEVQLTELDSDAAVFANFLGVPSLEFYYTDDNITHPTLKHPLRNSLYDTYYAVNNMLDPGFKHHTAMVQLVCEVLRSLSESTIMPLDVHEFAMSVKNTFMDFQNTTKDLLFKYGITIESLSYAVENFTEAAHKFQHRLKELDVKNSITARMVNDQLMNVEKAFLSNEIGNVASKVFRNVLHAPSASQDYQITSFAAIIDASAQVSAQKEDIMKQISIIAKCFHSASAVLNSKWL